MKNTNYRKEHEITVWGIADNHRDPKKRVNRRCRRANKKICKDFEKNAWHMIPNMVLYI